MRLSSIFYFSEREVKFSSIKKIKKNSKKNKKLNKTYTLMIEDRSVTLARNAKGVTYVRKPD